jgi:hypothetical protein
MLYDKVIDLAEKILSEYQTPVSLGKIRAELTGKEDLSELQNDISNKYLLKERSLDEIYREFFKLRAEMSYTLQYIHGIYGQMNTYILTLSRSQ